ncbi:MAG: hypothetical protein JWP58_1078 [Hymenobacter sp.]|nr:hypothetical protein [Hymenobacter sp.]
MNVPNLDQTIELYHGQACQLYWQIGNVLRRVAARTSLEPPKPVDGNLVLALPVLQRVAKRLYGVAQREADAIGPPSQRPRKFKLKVVEVVAIMLHVHPVATGAWPELGKVQQKSLNLQQYITFPK